jgi:tripartite-type tricarboxylate transporter receptor subunit TctC
VQEKLAKLGVEPSHMSVAEFKKFFAEDFAATRELAKQANIQPVD